MGTVNLLGVDSSIINFKPYFSQMRNNFQPERAITPDNFTTSGNEKG